jgi:hypothetical protein
MSAPVFLPLTTYREFPAEEMARRAKSFCDEMLRRRTVRQFSSRAVSREVIGPSIGHRSVTDGQSVGDRFFTV